MMRTKRSTQEVGVVRTKVLNFHSITSVIIAKLKTVSSQKVDTCKYKIDRGSDDDLMPLTMYKMLFPHTNINDVK